MSNDPIVLPIVTVQHDFQTVISDVKEGTVGEEDFWISCYKTGESSVHGKVRASLGDGGVVLKSRLGVELERGPRNSYSVSCAGLSIPSTRIRMPRQVVRDPDHADARHPQQINAFDVAPDLTQVAIGYHDGSIRRLGISSRTLIEPVTYRPHLSTVTSLRFFPSSRVLLAAGADFSLTILDAAPQPPLSASARTASEATSAAPPAPARTLRGHSRSITDTAIVARGRNVLSCAKDGTVRLWDVAGGAQIRVVGSRRYSPVLKMALGVKGAEWGLAPPDGEVSGEGGDADAPLQDLKTPVRMDEREVETGDKLLFCALQSGAFEVFDLGSKASVFHSGASAGTTSAPLESIAYSEAHNLVATGSGKGVVTVYDTRSLSAPLTSFSRNESSIEDLAFAAFPSGPDAADAHAVGLAIGTGDGLPYIAGVRPEGPDVLAELVGNDCEAVRVVRVDSNGSIWIAFNDNVVRSF